MALLCVWAAWHHTPMGALLRRAGAKVFGSESSARPLLAYYSGGASLYSKAGSMRRLPVLPRGLEITPTVALGVGLHATLKDLPASRRAHAESLAQANGIDPAALADKVKGPRACASLMEKLSKSLGSDDAAVFAAFAGLEPARYARDRVLAEGIRDPRLEDMQRHVPPGFEDSLATAHDALAFGVAYGLSWPVPDGTPISSGFGYRIHPVLGTRKLHTGIDLPLPVGTPVKAVADGVIRRASFDGVNGRVLVIDHGRGVTTAYCHNDALLVSEGDVVKRGAIVARSGNTGRSTGPHLHYQLELSNHPVDPLAYRPHLSPAPALSSEDAL